MMSGHLTLKKGYWYAVLSYKDETGKFKTKWFSTHLKERGNKKKAEEILMDLRIKHTGLADMRRNSNGIFFDQYMAKWLEGMKNKVAVTTYNSYKLVVQNSVCPYFKKKNILLRDLKPAHIKEYYDNLLESGLSNNTVIRHHANIRKALQEAYMADLIPNNPADRVERPKSEEFISYPYSVEEANLLLEALQGEKLEIVVKITLFYGLRRSEVLGLRWGAVNFENDTIIINHSVNQIVVDGKYTVISQDKLKRTASFRTMPLIPAIKEMLLQEKNARNPKAEDYICIDGKGKVIKPNYVSHEFNQLLKRHNLRHIRFHDLRHSCANLLIGQRIPLIEVQQWLGHSSILTTADTYSHLTFEMKLNSAETIKKI